MPRHWHTIQKQKKTMFQFQHVPIFVISFWFLLMLKRIIASASNKNIVHLNKELSSSKQFMCNSEINAKNALSSEGWSSEMIQYILEREVNITSLLAQMVNIGKTKQLLSVANEVYAPLVLPYYHIVTMFLYSLNMHRYSHIHTYTLQ